MNKVIRALAMPLVLVTTLGVAGLHLADAQDTKDKGGEYRFRLKDADGTLLATSGKGYDKKADCQKVIDTIKQTAAKAKVEEDTK